jgi:hypothetical protein
MFRSASASVIHPALYFTPLSKAALAASRALHTTHSQHTRNAFAALHVAAGASSSTQPRYQSSSRLTPIAPILRSRTTALNPGWIQRRDVRCFHATPRREGWPVLGAALLTVFKVCLFHVTAQVDLPSLLLVFRLSRTSKNCGTCHAVFVDSTPCQEF